MMSKPQSEKDLYSRLEPLLRAEDNDEAVRAALEGQSAADIALAVSRFPAESTSRVFAQLDEVRRAELLAELPPEEAAEAVGQLDEAQLNSIVDNLPLRDAAGAIAAASPELVRKVLSDHKAPDGFAEDVLNRAAYPVGSAGHLMTNDFVRLGRNLSVADAIELVRKTDPSRDLPNNLYVVEAAGPSGAKRERLVGVISLRDLVMCPHDRLVGDVMAIDLVTLGPKADDGEAADLLSRCKLLALPVVDDEGSLLGVIPADDVMGVVVARLRRRYAQSVGGDAEAMERMTPVQAAKTRTPWLIGTMVLELGAGLVIAHFSDVLERVILLASFMPVISAVSGNVGLQAAAITVRALDTGRLQMKDSRAALSKEAVTSLIMALVCGLVLGVIAVLWSRHMMLALVIGVAMAFSMLTAGLMGTIIPMVSKKLGFDPATTAGPFETAFQDIVGFAVFLGLATLMVDWIT